MGDDAYPPHSPERAVYVLLTSRGVDGSDAEQLIAGIYERGRAAGTEIERETHLRPPAEGRTCPGSRMEVVTNDARMRCPECDGDVFVSKYDHVDGTPRTMLIEHDRQERDEVCARITELEQRETVFARLQQWSGSATSLPRPHHLVWNGIEWVDDRCGCRYHPDDDDDGTHGGAPHVHRCERHAAMEHTDG